MNLLRVIFKAPKSGRFIAKIIKWGHTFLLEWRSCFENVSYHIWNRNICFFEMINWFFTAETDTRSWGIETQNFLCLAKMVVLWFKFTINIEYYTLNYEKCPGELHTRILCIYNFSRKVFRESLRLFITFPGINFPLWKMWIYSEAPATTDTLAYGDSALLQSLS